MSDDVNVIYTDELTTIVTAEESVTIIESIETGPQGAHGDAVMLQKSATHVQWKLTSEVTWTNLVALSEITGDPGTPAVNIELQKTSTYIQWRLEGGTWADLVALSDITGEKGDDGLSAYEVYLATNPSPILSEEDWLLSLNDRKTIYIQQFDFTADIETGDICGSWPVPFTGTILSVGANVKTTGVTGTMIIDIHKNGTSIMTTDKISIETGETDSEDATIQPILTTTSFVAGDLFTFEVDSLHTTPAKGLTIRMVIEKD